MKILAVMGSSKFGNTTEVVKCFLKSLSEQMEVETEYLYLADAGIEFCVGCHNCIMLGEKKCPHYQKVRLVEEKMMDADVVILASPGYMFSVTGVMKNFLDHVAYNCHRPKYFNKKMILIGNFTKWQEKGVFIPMETWASGAGFEMVGKYFTDMMPFPMTEEVLNKKKKTIEKAAVKISKKLSANKPRKVKFSDVIIFRVFRTLCKIAPNILIADDEYFKEIKANDKSSKWYIPTKVPVLFHWAGKFMEKMVKRQVIADTDMEELKNIKGRQVTRLDKDGN
ncbi:MAG: NAD(P)H-dependent oxidoreductase [Clostridiales bacterium]|nr:NAD(P)H-dependent oxidoreductase [Clostridiales bacterium]